MGSCSFSGRYAAFACFYTTACQIHENRSLDETSQSLQLWHRWFLIILCRLWAPLHNPRKTVDPPFRKMRTRQAAHTAPSSPPIGKSPWPGGGLCSGPARALTSPSPDSEPLDAIGTRLPGPGVWQNKSVLYPGNFVSDRREGQLPRNGTLLRRCRSDRTLLNQSASVPA